MTIERRFIAEKIQELDVKTLLDKELEGAGYSGCHVKKTPMGTHVIIRVIKPGLVIGAGGENIDKITKKLIALGIETPHIEVQPVENQDLDAKIVAWRIGKLLERGFYFKSVAMRTVEQVIRAGARGVEIRITGKVPSDRSRSWAFKQGYIRHCGETAKKDVLYGQYTAMLRSGMLGIKVRIMPPNVVFPDEIKLPEAEVPKIEVSGFEEAPIETENDMDVVVQEEELLEQLEKVEQPDGKTKEELARERDEESAKKKEDKQASAQEKKDEAKAAQEKRETPKAAEKRSKSKKDAKPKEGETA